MGLRFFAICLNGFPFFIRKFAKRELGSAKETAVNAEGPLVDPAPYGTGALGTYRFATDALAQRRPLDEQIIAS